jgi:predicted nucleic acid-binding protein
MALIVLDASVLIAHLDPGDAHHATATGLLDQCADDDLRLPASAYAESLVHPARKGQLAAARQRLDSLALAIEPITAPIAELAAALRAADPALRLPDALVLACGDTLSADQVVTGDRRWTRHGGRVRVIA